MSSAEVKILIEGYTNADEIGEVGEERTCPTISLVKDGDLIIVVDPGVLESQQVLADALQKEGLAINDVNMVCITHSHLDHYRNIGMFPNAKALDYFGIWDKNACGDWQEQFTPNIQILRTPGHDYTSITLFVKTDGGIVAICGDVFWKENSPEYDHNAKNEIEQKELKNSREMILKMAYWIIPGHGPMYKTEQGEKTVAGGVEKKEKEKLLDTCRKCKRPIKKQSDRCICQAHLCFRCCECDIDCDLCNCRHRMQ